MLLPPLGTIKIVPLEKAKAYKINYCDWGNHIRKCIRNKKIFFFTISLSEEEEEGQQMVCCITR